MPPPQRPEVPRVRPAPVPLAPAGVLVGVDGSDGSLWALDRAFAEAAAHGLPLHLLAVVNPVPGGFGPGVAELVDDSVQRLLQGMRDVVERAVDTVGPGHPSTVPVTQHVLLGDPIELLLSASTQQHMLVVGARGNGGFSRLLLGSVAGAVVHHAACPVLLVPARNTWIRIPVPVSD